jgi:uncharacterized protein (TIGR02391 family)
VATRTTITERPGTEIKHFTTMGEIDRAILSLTNRIEDIAELESHAPRYNDQRVRNVEADIKQTILELFGPNSPEYFRNRNFYFGCNFEEAITSEEQEQRQFVQGLTGAKHLLEGLIRNLEEKRSDVFFADPVNRVRTAFEGLNLHPRIASESAKLFRDGHYRNAVLDASLALVKFVKEKSRRHDLDGADLMRTVFSKKNPILAFNSLKEQTELDEQEGLMHLFEGAVLALRNPRAHVLTPDSPEEALEYIELLSFLAKQVDRAKRRDVD